MTSSTYEASTAKIIEDYENADLVFLGAVNGLRDAIAIENGYQTENEEDGSVKPDLKAVKEKAREIVVGTVRHSDDYATGLSQGDLFELVFPEHPDRSTANKIEAAAMAKLDRVAWGVTQTASSAYSQKTLDEHGLVLVRANVYRGNDEVEVVFATDEAELILRHALQPKIDELEKTAILVHSTAQMIVDRLPALGAGVQKAIEASAAKVRKTAQPTIIAGELAA